MLICIETFSTHMIVDDVVCNVIIYFYVDVILMLAVEFASEATKWCGKETKSEVSSS